MAKKGETQENAVDSAVMVELRPIETLIPYARNSRTHSEEQIGQLVASMLEWGFTNPVLADENGIVAGHGRVMAATRVYGSGRILRLPGGKELPKGTVPVIDCSGWSEAQRKAYIIADNKLALNAGWNFEMLAVELDELRDMDFDVGMVGFSSEELNDLIGTPNTGPEDGEGEDEDREPSDGELMALSEITIGDPRTKVERGDVFRLGGRHLVFCVSVVEDWSKWKPSLDGDGTLFLPFPSPFAAVSVKAQEFSLVMVQPDPYIAGHLIDRFIDIHGEDEVTKEGATS